MVQHFLCVTLSKMVSFAMLDPLKVYICPVRACLTKHELKDALQANDHWPTSCWVTTGNDP